MLPASKGALIQPRPSDGGLSESATPPGFTHVSLGHSLGAFPAPVGTRRSASSFHPSRSSTDLPGAPSLRTPSGSGFPKKKSPGGFGPCRGESLSSEPPQK